jgi:putative GTP pyrophosphokinase
MDDLLGAAGLRKADVDRLGDAMRRGPLTEGQINAFRAYSEAFAPALAAVVGALRAMEGYPVTERQKTLRATIAKLRRGRARLSQVQDIAGCRVVLPSINHQNLLALGIKQAAPEWRLYDRRAQPSHGYRAVHVVARLGALPVEVQVRTELQHSWAELSEAWDRRHEGIKYGTGPREILSRLKELSSRIAMAEAVDQLAPGLTKMMGSADAEEWAAYYATVMADAEATVEEREMLEAAGPGPEGPATLTQILQGRQRRMHAELREAISAAFPAGQSVEAEQ